MFRGWGFLLGEIWVLIALAALLGLFIGWLVWGRRSAVVTTQTDTSEAERLRRDLSASQARAQECAQRVTRLEADLSAARAAPVAAAVVADPVPMVEPPPAPAPPVAEVDPADVGTKPRTLDAARGGQADDLKRIKGIGPKLEILCNRLGFWHFDQIANWTDDEIAWVDANLESFKGRVTRDNWVAQAKVLAAENT